MCFLVIYYVHACDCVWSSSCHPAKHWQELIEALRKLGYRVETPNNKLPALFFGKGPARGSVTVSVEVLGAGKGCESFSSTPVDISVSVERAALGFLDDF